VFNGTIRNWQVVIPDFGTVAGPFHIGSFELTGRHDGEVAFDIALESAGELTLVAAGCGRRGRKYAFGVTYDEEREKD
jgi:predicted secreted protein